MSKRLRHYYECACGSTWSMVFEIGDHKPVDHAKHVVQQIIDKLPPAVRDKLPKQLPPPPTTPPPPPGSDAQDLLNYLLGG